jgi:hypothetical protein
MKNHYLAGLAFAFMAGSTCAADAPNIVGTWKPATGAYGTIGTEAKKAAPVFSDKPWHSEIKITEQKGRVFNGISKRPDGSDLIFVGVFASNGKNFSISADKGIWNGTYEGGKLDYCGTTVSMDYNLAFCSTVEKTK